ncbi:Origin recognition complex subunit 6 [Nakaseomyces bracarensis]|uniref:Origin recognition complex subunit 6 n=1 Tax=Nakaseomyces bracarensis TaxID=273131 RepID=A0ABR4NQV1_9SACH
MSNKQVQRCLQDILGYDESDEPDWQKGYLKKLVSATSTLYSTSVNKIQLTADEEVARCHICALLAAERLAEKHMPDLKYYTDKIPLQPRRTRNIVGYFKQHIFGMSPVKDMSWTPSPKKSRSPVKNADRFTSQNPDELRKQLFGTPTKSTGTPITIRSETNTPSGSPTKSPRKIRRKLAFEEDDDDDMTNNADSIVAGITRNESNGSIVNDSPAKTASTGPIFGNVAIISPSKKPEESDASRESSVAIESSPKRRKTDSPRKKIQVPLFEKKHANITAADIVKLCNKFELPKEVTYCVMEEFYARSTFLITSWQLLAGIVLNCVFIVFNERRRKDPRIDHIILSRMQNEMRCPELGEVIECTKMVKELMEGQKWYRDMEIRYNYFDGATYQEMIAKKLGSMLQPNNILATNDQYENWSRKVKDDISMRDLE